jgi:ATPase subunit of ABC transporter with duplicated ATPase domains
VSQLDIKLHSFSVYAGGKELVADATLNITMGGKYGLIGRNGIGKTSFLRALCR